MVAQNGKSCEHITIFFPNQTACVFLPTQILGDQSPKQLKMLLRGEADIFAGSLSYYSVLILSAHLF